MDEENVSERNAMALQRGWLLTVLRLELLVLLQSAEVFFPLLLQRCDSALQRHEVQVCFSCLGKATRPTIRTARLR